MPGKQVANFMHTFSHPTHIICECGRTFFALLPHEHLCMGWPMCFISGTPGVPGKNSYGGPAMCIGLGFM